MKIVAREKKITRATGQKFVSIFNKNSLQGLTAELIGGLVTKGYSEKDIDIKITYDWRKIPDKYQEEDLYQPLHWDIMEKIGANFLTEAGSFGEMMMENDSEWWDWRGYTVDVFFDEK